jgi:KaiC/GvpD/RAD55 family RecA-like ATPase
MGARVQSGLPGLDKLLEGGFPPGKVVLVLGEPGTGKSILASQYLMWGLTNAHENGVFIGMNESKDRYVSEMKGLGMDFEAFEKDNKFGFVDATDIRRIPDIKRVSGGFRSAEESSDLSTLLTPFRRLLKSSCPSA